jgi:hypothetical protein
MPRKKTESNVPASDSQDCALDRLTEVIDRLADEVHVLREAIDDIRAEVEWAIRNAIFDCRARDVVHVTSMPKDPRGPVDVSVHRQNAASLPEQVPQSDGNEPETASKQRYLWDR